MHFSRGSPNPGIEPKSPTLQADSLLAEPQGKPKNTGAGSLSLLQWILAQELNWESPALQLSYQGSPYSTQNEKLKVEKKKKVLLQ